MPFQPGQSGNPAGRPPGSRNKRTVLLENLLHGEGPSITRKLIELANGGELRAIRMCMDRLLPPGKAETVACDMPPMHNPMDAVAALSGVFEAVRTGDLTPAEAAKVAKLVHIWIETMGKITFERRLRQVEKQSGIAPPCMDSAPVATRDGAAEQPANHQAPDPSDDSEKG